MARASQICLYGNCVGRVSFIEKLQRGLGEEYPSLLVKVLGKHCYFLLYFVVELLYLTESNINNRVLPLF